MKKFLLVLVFMLGVCSCADTIGYIDSQKILKDYNKAITAQADLAKKQKAFQDLVLSKQQELEKAKVSSKNDEELIQLKEDFEGQLAPNRDELIEMNRKLSADIEKDILEATRKIAKQLRVDVVLDKQVVLVGGMDLTSLVLSSLNK